MSINYVTESARFCRKIFYTLKRDEQAAVLDRLGRSLPHLVTLTNSLMERQVGLISLNDPIDTTTAQGRLVFSIFVTLAESECDLVSERTQAGLAAARARGRIGFARLRVDEN